MKVKAKHWVKYGTNWHRAGDVFDVAESDANEMSAYAELIEGGTGPEETDEPEQAEPTKRGRRRKTEE